MADLVKTYYMRICPTVGAPTHMAGPYKGRKIVQNFAVSGVTVTPPVNVNAEDLVLEFQIVIPDDAFYAQYPKVVLTVDKQSQEVVNATAKVLHGRVKSSAAKELRDT